jgi:hypothetical protein
MDEVFIQTSERTWIIILILKKYYPLKGNMNCVKNPFYLLNPKCYIKKEKKTYPQNNIKFIFKIIHFFAQVGPLNVLSPNMHE